MSENIEATRHSLAHITASAVKRLWPDAKFGVGPVIENGFYYDIDLGETKITDSDFKKIEKEMRRIVSEDQAFTQHDKTIEEAIAWAENANQPYKLELLNDLKREGTTSAKDIDSEQLGVASEEKAVDSVGFYVNGDFEDLCRGPHVESTGKVGVFKLDKIAGAYWRGDETKPQMQRLYGLAFETEEEMNKYEEMMEEAKSRDHRKLGKELDLFTFSPLVGSGLPLFTPRGTVLRDKLSGYAQQLRSAEGYQRVSIPHITKPDLYKTSGHWDKFGDELFLIASQETSDSFVLKPMNCPHHTQIYASSPRSYKTLPLKYMETTMQYRDEKTGELHGLSRVRSISIDDSHVFCTNEQIEEIAGGLIGMAKELYATLDMSLKFRLSFRDDKGEYLGDEELWDTAQNTIEKLAKDHGLDYFVEPGEAAFYGPKIDYIAVDAIGREWQVATVQLDFVQPQRFKLEYVDNEGKKQTPVMVHSALLGSLERFLSVYIEHTNGQFPFWLAPEQVRIVTVNDTVVEYATELEKKLSEVVLMKPLKYNELRVSLDSRKQSLGKKLREAQNLKVPVTIIVGPKDVEVGMVSVKTIDGENKVPMDKIVEHIEGLA